MMEFVSWDDEIPNIWKVIKFIFQTTNQHGDLVLNMYDGPFIDVKQKMIYLLNMTIFHGYVK